MKVKSDEYIRLDLPVVESYDFKNSIYGQLGSGLDRQEQANILYRYLINQANTLSKKENMDINTKIIVYTNLADQDNTQPIIYVERLPQVVKEFDLALRKYITKLGNKTLTGVETRVPNIDESTIKTQNTATYKHRKDPVIVKNGDVVTYNLTIYNEGEKSGRATKIVDQLPTGLQFSKINTSGFTADYNSSTNRLTINRNVDNTTNLEAYKENDLKSETIEIECIVTAKSDTQGEKILTNVAWIAEEYDAVDNVIIINQDGKDRDSKPSVTPNVNKDNMTDYTGNDNKSDLSDPTYYYKGQEDDDDFEKLKLEKENEGSYNIYLVKQDANGEDLKSTATFIVNDVEKRVTGRLEIASNVKITSENLSTPDTYRIIETVAPDEYCKFNGIINITVTKKNDNGSYKIDDKSYTVTDTNGKDITADSKDTVNVELINGNLYVYVKNYQFDLKLVKRIIDVNGNKVPERIQNVDITNLANGTETTAKYDLDKNPVAVKKGDIVKYTLRVYNEGNIDGYASEITEDIPEGLEFVWSEKTEAELDADTSLTKYEKEAIKYNQSIWDIKSVNTSNNRVELISTDYLAKGKGAEIATDGANLIKAFDSSKEYKNTINDKNPDYKEVSVYMKVISNDVAGTIIRNEAAITDDTDKDGNKVDDRDSDTDVWVKYEDDEDFDNVVLQAFDLSLRKFIIAVSKDTTIGDSEYLKNSDGTYTRAPQVDTSKLNTIGEDGKLITTATFTTIFTICRK